jgi:hypothetical protein
MTARPPKRLFHLVFESHEGRALGAESKEKHEPVSDIDTRVADSLKALDPADRLEKRTIKRRRFVPEAALSNRSKAALTRSPRRRARSVGGPSMPCFGGLSHDCQLH